jgi:alkylation response protein AidB-like acyl-CoA dehydrogenase
MHINADKTLLEAARNIAPVIRDHNEEAEREGRLSRPVLDALYETGLLKMFTPRSLGGLEVSPITRARVTEEIAAHDTAAAWTLFNPLDWAHLCARLPDEGVEEIYSDGADILIAAQYGRPLKATPSRDGYRVSGKAPFVSNCQDANWIAMTAMVMDGEQTGKKDQGEPEMLMVYFTREQCQVIDNWNVIGMRGTGSHDVSVTDVFVPKTRTFPMVPEFVPGSHYQSPLYRFPLVGVSATSLPPVMLAVARQAIDYVSELAQGKMPVASRTLLRERSSAQARLAQAEAILRSGQLLLYDTLSVAWEATLAGEEHSLKQKADLLLAMTHSVNSAKKAVELVYSIAGTSGIRTGNPLERYFRDIQVIRHHAFAAEARYETVGQVYLGIPPDFPAITF